MEQQVFGGQPAPVRPARSLWSAMGKGFRCKCPNCGQGKLFSAFVKTVERCGHCDEELYHHRADDLPAYLVLVIVGHIVVGSFMGVEATSTLAMWQHLAIWVPLTIIASIALLQPVKGSVVGLQWANYMHGFGGEGDLIETHPEA